MWMSAKKRKKRCLFCLSNNVSHTLSLSHRRSEKSGKWRKHKKRRGGGRGCCSHSWWSRENVFATPASFRKMPQGIGQRLHLLLLLCPGRPSLACPSLPRRQPVFLSAHPSAPLSAAPLQCEFDAEAQSHALIYGPWNNCGSLPGPGRAQVKAGPAPISPVILQGGGLFESLILTYACSRVCAYTTTDLEALSIM